ncbi:MAG: hypothetical protein ACOYB0_09660 [Polynucleobacter sp.]
MAIKYIPDAWKTDLAENFSHTFNFYINPRCRVFPALTSAGVSYIENDANINMRGTFRLQAGATTDLTFLYTLPQRFILEGWFNPEFAYDVAGNQTIFAAQDAAEFSIIYNATTDKIDMIQSPGTTISTPAYTLNSKLQTWKYIRAYYDNVAKQAGFYIWEEAVDILDTENTPGAGDFVPLNTISFFPTVALESSYWVIHEVEETLAAGEYKTYQADRQIMFDFNGLALGRERILLKRSTDPADMRGVISFNTESAIENPWTGSAVSNGASITMHNLQGQFSDDQYDAFDPFNGCYNGPEKYLQNRVPIEIESVYAKRFVPGLYPSDNLYPSNNLYPSSDQTTSYAEPLFIGRTESGAFSRSSPSHYLGKVTISANDYVAELGETKLPKAHVYNNSVAAYELSSTADESLSLVHLLARLVTKHEIKNYANNSSFENATIGNSWASSGLTLTRDATYPQFGTYSAKAVSGSAGDYFRQTITFVGDDKLDVGDKFNFSAYIRQGTASAVRIKIEELDNSYAALGYEDYTNCGTTTGLFIRDNVYHVIQSPLCNRLRISFVSLAASTFYVDGAMFSRGIDPAEYMLINATDGSSGICIADDAASYSYDTMAIKADSVALSHPFAVVDKGDDVWKHLKYISEACIPRYLGMTPDGVFCFDIRYNETDPAVVGVIDGVKSISTSLEANGINSILVSGCLIKKYTNNVVLWDGASILDTNDAGNTRHLVEDGEYLEVNGTSVIEAEYCEGQVT